MATDFLVKQGRVMGGVRLVTDADVAHQTDLTNIRETGTTASQAISAGTYFYLNDTLVRAKTAIANGATFTLNTNYEVVTAGALNELRTALNEKTETIVVPLNGTTDASGNYYTGINKTSIPPISGVLFDTDSTSYDGLYIPFISPVTAGLYLHVTNFAQVSQSGVTVKGNLHITRRI